MRPRYRLRPEVVLPIGERVANIESIASLPPGVVYHRLNGLTRPMQCALARNPDWYDQCVDYLLEQEEEEEEQEEEEQEDHLFDVELAIALHRERPLPLTLRHIQQQGPDYANKWCYAFFDGYSEDPRSYRLLPLVMTAMATYDSLAREYTQLWLFKRVRVLLWPSYYFDCVLQQPTMHAVFYPDDLLANQHIVAVAARYPTWFDVRKELLWHLQLPFFTTPFRHDMFSNPALAPLLLECSNLWLSFLVGQEQQEEQEHDSPHDYHESLRQPWYQSYPVAIGLFLNPNPSIAAFLATLGQETVRHICHLALDGANALHRGFVCYPEMSVQALRQECGLDTVADAMLALMVQDKEWMDTVFRDRFAKPLCRQYALEPLATTWIAHMLRTWIPWVVERNLRWAEEGYRSDSDTIRRLLASPHAASFIRTLPLTTLSQHLPALRHNPHADIVDLCYSEFQDTDHAPLFVELDVESMKAQGRALAQALMRHDPLKWLCCEL